MLKSLSLTMTFLLSLNTFATDSIESATALYSERGSDYTKALEASNMYKRLAETQTDTAKKAELLTKQSQAIYYYGSQSLEASKGELLKTYSAGINAAKAAANLLANNEGLTNVEENKTPLARAYYFFSANLGKWGETKGVLASLSKWKKELKPTLKKIIKLDPTVEQWGANRIMGRAFQKVPYESTSDGLEFMTEAFDETYNDDFELASNMTTNEYYLYLLKDEKEWDIYCEVYSAVLAFNDEDQEAREELNPGMLPETNNTLKVILESKSLKKSFNKKCE